MGKKCSFACLLVLFLVQVNCDEALEELEDIANESEFQGIPSKNILAKYDGAQLLRIPNVEQLDKNAVTELQTKYEAAMWSLQSESVDMFLKKSLVDKAKSFLKSSNVNFDVIIADVQNAIDSENPPKDQLELWQNRNGKNNNNH